MLKEAILYEREQSGKIRCQVCRRRCLIAEGRMGYCGTRLHRDGVLYSTIYGLVSSAAADPIEKKPVYHYRPGSKVFSLGSFGCNFRCIFCQNWQIAYADALESVAPGGTQVSAEAAVQLAVQNGCQGIAWTYNEPTIWLEYVLDSARLARAHGLYTVLVTNGYATEEALDVIGPYLDVYRVDFKSFSARFYQDVANAGDVEGIKETASRARRRWQMHVEVVTNLVPGYNDRAPQLAEIASWIRENLGEHTPWHLTRFFPHARLTDVPPTPLETLHQARDLARREGLRFVYLGNVPDGPEQNTYCPQGGELVVARSGYRTKLTTVRDDGTCAEHGAYLNLVL